ncbi:multisubunit sodium/proton antiporter, MrpD subunit [Halopenitus malekzadehii]|uniref:Multisubunit sodium/proton antiporter, MrpD subunit n=1 Tax=Halopenitus malekzadehii TaxID=1267564 RepID=A0A1H6J3N1_9EURY|nr:proton-conducting transporter membrane subunit [Halopenitus malekzadehii]SEH55259.1 multisubunit sodium/proton antiporter, MrpD subunit [Halopenitus malekzadehii]
MTEVDSLRPLFVVLVSFVASGAIVASHRRPNLREGWTLLAAVAKFAAVVSLLPGVLAGTVYVTEVVTFLPYVEFTLRADPLGMLFAVLASGLWIITSLYSIGYMRGLDEPNQTRYFAAFAVSLSTTMGIAFAGNLITIFIFYELLSIATYPLVAHDETPEARSAGRKYLAYTMFGGGVFVLAGTVLVYWLTGLVGEPTVAFSAGGIDALATAASSDPLMAKIAFVLLGVGFAVKAGLMPLHQWLPEAMVAPTPVSGLLHAVAVVKSGAFGVSRIVLDVFGPEVVFDLGVGVWLSVMAAVTLTAASIIALRKDHLKQRLAYSTVSQLSYILLGLGLFGWHGLVGALLHIPAHAFMKLTLFFCAGCIHVETHTDYISEMAGIGKRMPVTMAAFTVAAAGMAGIPLVAGFVSKFYMLVGGIAMGAATPIGYYLAGALLLSGVLNIAYFWPVVYTAFFEAEDAHDAKPLVEFPLGGRTTATIDAVRTDGGDRKESDDDGTEREDGTATGADAETPIPDAEDEAGSEEDDPTESGDDGTEANVDDGVVRPDFAPGDRDFSEPAERVDTGNYAVDTNPSDTDVPFSPEGGSDDRDAGRLDERDQRDHADQTDHADHDHHGGPPPSGWRSIRGLTALLGRETTWFMLAPILTAMTLAVLLGVIPSEMAFLDLIELIVETRLEGAGVGL